MVRIFKDGGLVDSVRNRQKFRGSDRFEFRKKGVVRFGLNFENTLWFNSVQFGSLFLLKKNKTLNWDFFFRNTFVFRNTNSKIWRDTDISNQLEKRWVENKNRNQLTNNSGGITYNSTFLTACMLAEADIHFLAVGELSEYIWTLPRITWEIQHWKNILHTSPKVVKGSLNTSLPALKSLRTGLLFLAHLKKIGSN